MHTEQTEQDSWRFASKPKHEPPQTRKLNPAPSQTKHCAIAFTCVAHPSRAPGLWLRG